MTNNVSETQRLNNKNNPRKVELPNNASGILSVDELQSAVTAVQIKRVFPNGLLGIKVKLFQAGTAAAARQVFVAFNNRAQNDTAIAGLRHVVEIGGQEAWAFDPDELLPTEVSFLVDANEVALGDTVTYIEAVQKP